MNTKIPDRYVKIILGALVVVFLSLCFLFEREYSRLYRLELVGQHHFFTSALSRRPLTSSDVGMIQVWMTFEYINVTFNIPKSFLESNLNITDTRYPQVSLSRYARGQKSDPNVVLTQVQNAVRGFLDAKK